MGKLCRVCMASEGPKNFYKFFDKRFDFAQKLFYITSITIFEISKNLPALICQECVDDLEKAARIKKIALETDEFFKDIYGSEDITMLTEIINEDQVNIKQDPDDFIIEELLEDYEFEPSTHLEMLDECQLDPQPPKNTKKKTDKRRTATLHPCTIGNCKRIFKKPSELLNHQYIHFDARNFSCDICGALFKTKGVLASHRKIHLNIRYMCDLCGGSYRDKVAMRRHAQIEHLKTLRRKRFMCHLCGKEFGNRSMLGVHMLYSHEGVKNFKCEICDKAFFTKSKLSQHVDALHGERPWECGICNRNFSKRYRLGEHMKQRHSMKLAPMKKFICTLCGVSFDRNKLLKEHLRDKHAVVMEEDNVAEIV